MAAPRLSICWADRRRLCSSLPSRTLAYIKAGKLHPLAVTSATRSAALPDVPTVSEFVPGYEATAWFGIGAPKNTPVEIIDKLNREVSAGLADPKIQERLADLGGGAAALPPKADVRCDSRHVRFEPLRSAPHYGLMRKT
ncbi:MAG: tripartite tricarboxylate transporter substrate-binding protein [Xanthobacteraceae bacterium]